MRKYRIAILAIVLLAGAYTIGVIFTPASSKQVQNNTATSAKVIPKQTGQSALPAANPETVATKSASKDPAGDTAASQSDAAPKGNVTPGVESWTKAERRRQIIAGVDQTFGKAIAGLGLDENDQRKLRSLLIERAEAAWDAHDLATESARPTQNDLNQALKIAETVSREEMAKAFRPAILAKIQSMIEAAPYIRQINQHYDPAMAQAGVPLTPEQVLPLSEILYHTFGSINNPLIESNRHQIDPATGLTPLDVLALERSKSVLTPAQLEIVKQKIAAINRAYYLRPKS